MEDTISGALEMAKFNMDSAIEFLEQELLRIRAGKASPDMVSGVVVDYYGSPTPVSQVANVSASDARTLTITPWEKNMIPIIEKAVRDANLGFNPGSDGDCVRIPIPSLTEERRKSLVKQAKDVGENAKVSIRKARQDANKNLEQLEKDGESEDDVKKGTTEVQTLTNNYGKKVDAILKKKEEQIMTV